LAIFDKTWDVTLVNILAISMETVDFQKLLFVFSSYWNYMLRNGVLHVA